MRGTAAALLVSIGALVSACNGAGPTPERCAPSPTGDPAWALYPLPATPGHPRNYDIRENTVIDCVTGLEWERLPDDVEYTHAEALAHCEHLALDGGGWQLPSTMELVTLVDYDVLLPGPSIDEVAFPDTPTAGSWASAELQPTLGSGGAWFVYFYPGITQATGETASLRARCVRTHPGGPPGPFTAAGDGTVRAERTGLVWEQGFSATTMSQPEAVAHCAGLALAGGGWRLPTVIELRSIVDESRANPSIDLASFPGTPVDSFWSSTATAGAPGGAWFIMFATGAVNNDQSLPLTTMHVRCVR